MNKYLRVLIVFILLFLVACKDDEQTETVIPTEITIPTDPIVSIEPFEYTIDLASFESFFLIKTEILETENSQLVVNLEPLSQYNDLNGNATLKVYVSYMFKHVNLKSEHEFVFNLKSITEETETLNNLYHDFQIFYIEVVNVSGTLSTENDMMIQQKSYKAPVFTPDHDDIFVIENQALNQQLFDELDVHMEDILANLDYHYLTYSTRTTQAFVAEGVLYSEVDENIVQFADQYIYYKNITGSGIVQNEGDRLFHYYMNPLYIVSNKQVLEMSVIESVDDLIQELPMDGDIDESLFVPDSSKMSISKNGSNYTIIGYIRDFISPLEYQIFSQQLNQLDIDLLILEQATMTLTIEISEDELMITTEISIELPHTLLSLILAKVEVLYSYRPFDKIDIKSDDYIIEPPNEFNEITSETNVLEEVSQVIHGQNHKYLTYLEKGQYKFVDLDEQRLSISVYDIDFNNKYATPLPSHIYGIEVFIHEDGYYYLNINQTLSNNFGYSFYLEARNYETTWHDDEVLNLGVNTITFEGELDFVRFKFNSDEVKVLKIFTENKDIIIFPNHYFYVDGIHFVEIPVGISYFTLTSLEANISDIEVTEVDTSNYISQTLDSMEEIQDVLSDLIVTSRQLGQRYLKLIVTEKTYYKLEYLKASESNSFVPASLFDQNLVKISSFSPSGVLLDEGTYVIGFGSTEVSLGYVKYHTIDIENKTIELDMTTVEYNEMVNQSLNYYAVTLYHQDSFVDFHFSSTENTALFIRGGNHYQIFDEQKNPLTMVFGDNFYTQVNQVFYFEPGDYYIRFFSKFNFMNMQNIWLAFLSNPPEDDSKVGSSIPSIALGDHVFELNYPEDTEIVKIEIIDQGFYSVYSNINGYPTLYDSIFNRMPQDSDGYYLSPGIYYVFLPNRGGANRSLNIRKVG